MSQAADEVSSLDTLLGKYGAGGRKRSLRLSESGESSTDERGEWGGREEPSSQFLKEIRERAQILSKNAAKSRKAALQTVVNEDHRAAATTSESHSLDLFMDVIRNAAIQDDRASQPAAVPPADGDGNGDDLLQPMVPLDAAPWAAEEEGAVLAAGDYYQGEGGVRPWGVTTTESCLDESDDDDDGDDDDDESDSDEDVDGATTGQHAGRVKADVDILNGEEATSNIIEGAETKPGLDAEDGSKSEVRLDDSSSNQVDGSGDIDQQPDPASTTDDVSSISSDDAEDEQMPREDLGRQREDDGDEDDVAQPEPDPSLQAAALEPLNDDGESPTRQVEVGERSEHSPLRLSASSEDEGRQTTKQRVEAVLDDLLQGEIKASENRSLDGNDRIGSDHKLMGSLRAEETESSPAKPEKSGDESWTRPDGPGSTPEAGTEAAGVASTDRSHSRLSEEEPVHPQNGREDEEPVTTVRQNPKRWAGMEDSPKVDSGKTDRVDDASRAEDRRYRHQDSRTAAADSLPGPGEPQRLEKASPVGSGKRDNSLRTEEVSARAEAESPSRERSSPTWESKSSGGDKSASDQQSSEMPTSIAGQPETAGQGKVGKITRPTVLLQEGASRRRPRFEERQSPGDRAGANWGGLRAGSLSSSPQADLRASLRGLAGLQRAGTFGGGEPSPQSPGGVRDLIARFNSGSTSSSPADSPRYEKVIDWNVFPPRAKQWTGEGPSHSADASTTYPLRHKGGSSDGSAKDIPWMRELKERRKRRDQGHVLAKLPP